jgi:RNA polymerase sigma-70 factor (ECF subfamily)
MSAKDQSLNWPVLSRDEEELVREFRSGSAQALGVVFERYYRLVFATAWRVLRDTGEAEDLTQSVFLEIFRKASHFDPARGPLNKWILTLAYHRSLNRKSYLMTRQFYKGHVDLIGENGEELWSTSLMLPAQEAARLVKECLRLLDARQREVLELVFFKELTFKEIADQTQQTFGNVRNQYYRGLKRLRAHLSGPSREEQRRGPQITPVLRDSGQQSQRSRIASPLRAPSGPHSLRKDWSGNLEWRREALAAFQRVGVAYFEIVPGAVARIGDLKMSS